jgi:hypothetical protein
MTLTMRCFSRHEDDDFLADITDPATDTYFFICLDDSPLQRLCNARIQIRAKMFSETEVQHPTKIRRN